MLLHKLVVKWCYEYQGSCSRERLCGKGVADSFSSRKADGYVVWWWAFFIHSRVEWFDVDTSLYIITSWLFINTRTLHQSFQNLKSFLSPEGLTSQNWAIKQIISSCHVAFEPFEWCYVTFFHQNMKFSYEFANLYLTFVLTVSFSIFIG